MKLNWAERWVVNNPSRVFQQKIEIGWLKKKMPLKPGGAVLEIGCGRGAGAGLIRRTFNPGLMHAQDLDIEMIQRAKRYLGDDYRRHISLSVADSVRIPFKDRSFDAVFDFGVLHHVPDWQAALSEIERILKPGGIFYIEELYPALYLNFITRHILLHPVENRFRSGDFRSALQDRKMPLQASFEVPGLWLLGIAVKNPVPS
ncbi:MAG: class I SAM-dependent methyltransferase [Thermodesulfobacteriota bacterium]